MVKNRWLPGMDGLFDMGVAEWFWFVCLHFRDALTFNCLIFHRTQRKREVTVDWSDFGRHLPSDTQLHLTPLVAPSVTLSIFHRDTIQIHWDTVGFHWDTTWDSWDTIWTRCISPINDHRKSTKRARESQLKPWWPCQRQTLSITSLDERGWCTSCHYDCDILYNTVSHMWGLYLCCTRQSRRNSLINPDW